MSSIRSRSFDEPDVVREFPYMHSKLVQIGSIAVGHATLEPGWRWTTSRSVLHDYFAWATTTSMAQFHASADDVPRGLEIPRWSWQGLVGDGPVSKMVQ